jgi:hypothetical protein
LPPGCSFCLPNILGDEVDDARDDSWRGSFVKRLSLPTSGVDVVGLACPLHRPMVYNYHELSCFVIVVGGNGFWGM